MTDKTFVGVRARVGEKRLRHKPLDETKQGGREPAGADRPNPDVLCTPTRVKEQLESARGLSVCWCPPEGEEAEDASGTGPRAPSTTRLFLSPPTCGYTRRQSQDGQRTEDTSIEIKGLEGIDVC